MRSKMPRVRRRGVEGAELVARVVRVKRARVMMKGGGENMVLVLGLWRREEMGIVGRGLSSIYAHIRAGIRVVVLGGYSGVGEQSV